jgi:hypothetical protein
MRGRAPARARELAVRSCLNALKHGLSRPLPAPAPAEPAVLPLVQAIAGAGVTDPSALILAEQIALASLTLLAIRRQRAALLSEERLDAHADPSSQPADALRARPPRALRASGPHPPEPRPPAPRSHPGSAQWQRWHPPFIEDCKLRADEAASPSAHGGPELDCFKTAAGQLRSCCGPGERMRDERTLPVAPPTDRTGVDRGNTSCSGTGGCRNG